MRGVHDLAPYRVALPCLAASLDPRQPFAAYDTNNIRQAPRACPAPLRDRDEAEPLGMAKRILDGPPADSGLSGDRVDAEGTAAAVSVLVSNDPEHGVLGRREGGGELCREWPAIGESTATLA